MTIPLNHYRSMRVGEIMKPENYPSEPKHLWDTFFDFTQTPRPSKEEGAIRDYLVKLANEHDLKHIVDAVGNVIIYVPGKNGREKDAPVIIQNHIDMVTDALAGREIDFSRDPIKTLVDGDWLTADRTTLGADNGIGCAAALATIFEKDLVHPPLELLFTVDEETGLNGALGLETKYLSGKKMLNLDTEEWGSLYIGCAGGIDYEFNQKFDFVNGASGLKSVKIDISGFIGGHSGLDIHEQRGNAIKFLAEILGEIKDKLSFELCEIKGGKAHNIIPREAFAVIRINETDIEKLDDICAHIEKRWRSFLPELDKAFVVNFEELEDASSQVLSDTDFSRVLGFILLMPHGAHKYDLNAREIVSMSNNLAKVILKNGEFYSQSSLRFFDREEIKSLETQLRMIGKTFNINCETHSEYPSWKPVIDNPVLDTVKNCYKELYGDEPVVTAIHAGLECGILKSKLGELDVVSFGPTITGAHSPDERVYIPSVHKFWDLYKTVLKAI